MKNIYLILFLIPLFANAQIFVDQSATGMNDGTSWSDAYTDLQDAIENATLAEQIWVAAGTYLPSTNGNVDTSFVLKQSIELYGGFAGTESNLSQRDVETNLTTISGDYNNDDDFVTTISPVLLTFNNYTDNAKRIFSADNVIGSLVIDGFTVSGGNNASGSAMLFSPDDSLTVLVKNCTIKENNSTSGGAIYITTEATEKLNFRFENSTAINNACYSGAQKGGAFFATGAGEANVEFVNILFHQNATTNRGGAINMEGNVNPSFQNCIFSENRSNNGGAIFELQTGQSTYENCVFYNNVYNQQGIIFNYNNFKSILNNCIFYNHAGTNTLYGGGGYEIGNSVLEYNNWAGLSSNSTDLGGNQYEVNPLFVNEAAFDFNLSASSPMIDAGNNSAVLVTTDHTGYIARIVDNTVDIGAFEYHLPFSSSFTADTEVCFAANNASASITADNYAPFTYEWNVQNVQGANPTNLPSGNLEVKVVNAIGDFEVHSFVINQLPEIMSTTSFTYPTSSSTDGTATVSVAGGLAPFTYEWNTTPVQTDSMATGLAEGIYSVVITDANACTKSDTFDLYQPNAIASIDNLKEIQIGPNPLSENLFITISQSLLENASLWEVNIFNTSGQLVYTENLNSTANNQLNLNQLSTGLYVLELKSHDLRFNKLIVKQ